MRHRVGGVRCELASRSAAGVPEEPRGNDAQRLPVEAAAEAVQNVRLHRQRRVILGTNAETPSESQKQLQG